MYLTIRQCEKLDSICNRFEVALRSYVSNNLLNKKKIDESIFNKTLSDIALNFKILQPCIPIQSIKYSEKAKSLLSKKIYSLLENANESYLKKDITGKDVLTVGELLDIIILLYNPAFIEIGNGFNSIEKFISLLSLYHTTRNLLAHPALAKILIADEDNTIFFIEQVINQIDSDYFWYSSKLEIKKLIIELKNEINEEIVVINNLEFVPKKHNKLILREEEIVNLANMFMGESEMSRRSGSVELHGYGGVGKTALSLELCYELIRRERNNRGIGYSFILWLSSKTEELTFNSKTGKIFINDMIPNYQKSYDIISNLKKLLKLDYSINEDDLIKEIYNQKIKGLIVLDNIETLDNEEKIKIKKLIKKFPQDIQFLITSRNFEGIADTNIEVKGFDGIENGKKFILEYCSINNIDIELSKFQLESFIKYSYGNTLILVICLQRIHKGILSIDSIIDELQVYQNKEIDIIAEFMYKRTFDSTIIEIETGQPLVDIKSILRIMLLYEEPIDFSSLRELLDYPDSLQLDNVLNELVNKFIMVKSGSYYELHEFAQKFIILKLLPDKVQLSKMDTLINEYKINLKDSLKKLYEDKANFNKLETILEDWKAMTESEIIAIAKAYSEYDKVSKKVNQAKNNKDKILKIFDETKLEFKKIETRSHHPYIKYQKGKVLRKILYSYRFNYEESNNIKSEILESYEDAYITIKLRNTYIINTESYANFLLIYGINQYDIGKYPESIKTLEESVERYNCLNDVKDKNNMAKANNALSLSYAMAYLQTKDEKYLNKTRIAINEARRFYNIYKISKEDETQLTVLLIFTDVVLKNYKPKEIRSNLVNFKNYPRRLDRFMRVIKENVYNNSNY